MNEAPATAPCGRCGQSAYVGRDGIHCACLPGLSAQENLERIQARLTARRDAA